MKNEIIVLRHIDMNGYSTQRDIAKLTGISLGTVNILLKRLVHRGLVTVEVMNSRTIQYKLTTEGKNEKLDAAYKYANSSLKAVSQIERALDDLLSSHLNNKRTLILLLEQRDEINIIIKKKLDENGISNITLHNSDEISKYQNNGDYLALTWNSASVEYFAKRGVKSVNILEEISFEVKEELNNFMGV